MHARYDRISPNQPWLALQVTEYSEKSIKWNRDTFINNALCYQFTTRSNSHDLIMVPDGCMNILFACGGESPGVRIVGVHEKPLRLSLEPDTVYFGFKPYSAAGLSCEPLGVDIAKTANRVLSRTLIGDLERLHEQLGEAATLHDRVECFLKLVAPRLIDMQYSRTIAEYFAAMIRTSGGAANIGAMVKNTGYSQRYCRSVFTRTYGFSMKQYSRFVRIQHVMRNIVENEFANLSTIAKSAGFYDLSHLIRDFKQLTLCTPLEFKQFSRRERETRNSYGNIA